jgi:hypothetical protein
MPSCCTILLSHSATPSCFALLQTRPLQESRVSRDTTTRIFDNAWRRRGFENAVDGYYFLLLLQAQIQDHKHVLPALEADHRKKLEELRKLVRVFGSPRARQVNHSTT